MDKPHYGLRYTESGRPITVGLLFLAVVAILLTVGGALSIKEGQTIAFFSLSVALIALHFEK